MDVSKPGDILAVLDSVELGQAQMALQQSLAKYHAAQETHNRARLLYEGRRSARPSSRSVKPGWRWSGPSWTRPETGSVSLESRTLTPPDNARVGSHQGAASQRSASAAFPYAPP